MIEEGIALAEFDIEVRGKVGTGEISWLIECRDRPAGGAAPGSWIEQLIGRKARFNFSKVTAVSSTGFSPSARLCAKEEGIELRELNSIDQKDFAWLQLEHLRFREKLHELRMGRINIVKENTSSQARADLLEIVKTSKADDRIFLDKVGGKASLMDVFFRVTHQLRIWDQLTEPSAPVSVRLLANYSAEDRYVIVTKYGNIEVGSIQFEGELSIRETLVAPQTFKYAEVETGATISEVVKFPVTRAEQDVSIEIHKISGTQEMQIVFRDLKKLT